MDDNRRLIETAIRSLGPEVTPAGRLERDIYDPAKIPHAAYRQLFGPHLFIELEDVLDTPRWGKAPDIRLDLVFCPIMPRFSLRGQKAMSRYFEGQPPAVLGWLVEQKRRYGQTFFASSEDLAASLAMLDAVLWQWECALAAIMGWIPKVLEAERLLWRIDELQVWQLFRQRPDLGSTAD